MPKHVDSSANLCNVALLAIAVEFNKLVASTADCEDGSQGFAAHHFLSILRVMNLAGATTTALANAVIAGHDFRADFDP